jgi:hypothetical protein
VPAEVGWPAVDAPNFASVHTERKIALGFHHACAVCGYELPAGSRVYRAFAQADAVEIRLNQRERTMDPSGPLHLSCVLYSAMACPYLREKTSRLGSDNTINPGARRGTRASVMGFEGYGLLICTQPFGPPTELHTPQFAYHTLIDDIHYQSGTELSERYAAAVETDAALIEVDGQRKYWDWTQNHAVEAEAIRALKVIKKRSALYPTGIAGHGYYNCYPL